MDTSSTLMDQPLPPWRTTRKVKIISFSLSKHSESIGYLCKVSANAS